MIQYANLKKNLNLNKTWLDIHVFQTDEEYEEYKTNRKFNAVNIEFITETDIKRPKLSDDGSFCIVYPPKKLKLRPSNRPETKIKLT